MAENYCLTSLQNSYLQVIPKQGNKQRFEAADLEQIKPSRTSTWKQQFKSRETL